MTDVETTVSYDKPEKISVDESKTSENINTDLPESGNIAQDNSETAIGNVVSEEKNNANITPVDQKTQKNRLTLIDSDSEDEIVSENLYHNSSELINVSQNNFESINENQNNVDNLNDSDNESVERVNTKTNKNRLIDSDSDDDENSISKVVDKNEAKDFATENTTSNDGHYNKKINKKIKNRLTLVDSDSENEENNSVPKSSEKDEDDEGEKEDTASNDNQTQKKKSRLLHIYDSDSDDEKKTTTSPETNKSVITMTFQTDVDVEHEQTIRRLKTLCDSESSPEETEDTFEEITKDNIIKQKRTKKIAEPTEKKMTGKEALEQRRQIRSESQKMARETRVHLPYHRPKQHTLQEFLKRRSLYCNDTLKAPPNTPTCLSIKMVNKKLKIVDQKFKSREKEIEEFYKSESEEEEEPEPKLEKTEKIAKKTTEKIEESDEIPSEEIRDKKIETSVDKPEEMEINGEVQLEKSSEEIQQEKIPEDELQTNVSEETLQEVEFEEKSSEETQKEKETGEYMEVEDDEQSSNNDITEETNYCGTKELEQISSEVTLEKIVNKLLEPEQNNDEFADLNESNEEDKEAKLKELREILEKNLACTEPVSSFKESIDEEPSEPETIEQYSELETTQIDEDEKAKKKKLAEIEERLKKLNPIMALKSNLHPRLSGGPNNLIVLDDDIEKSKRVTNLMQRFLKHTAKKTVHKKFEVNIINVEGGVINKERITLTEEEGADDEPAKKIQIPGVKMKKLRLELEDQIIKKRLDEWKKRQEDIKLDNEDCDTYAGEKQDCGELGNKILDNEEEEEFTDPSSSESEEEEEEEIKEKVRVKSAYVDEEAEDSDADENEEAVEDNEDNEEYEDEEEDEDEDEVDEREDEASNNETATKKPLRRIIKPTDDSDDETSSRPGSSCGKQRKIRVSTSDEHFTSQTPSKNAIWDDNDDDIPAYQPQLDGLEKTPSKFASQNKNDFSTFLTPTLHLTALQGMNSASKSLQGSPNVNSFLPPEPSPLKSNRFIKTKLFTDQESVDNNLDELEGLCSGKFTTQANNNTDETNHVVSTQENELINICSGEFSGITQNESTIISSSLSVKSTQSLDLLNNEESQNFKLTIENEATANNLDEEITDSQLLKLSFKDQSQQNTINISKNQKMVIASSSEDEDKENETPKKKKLKKKKRKYIIDDISITDEDELEEDRLQELDSADEVKINRNIEYDSDENEIEFEQEEANKPTLKASDFFEAEAELSESEWGSADEDEKNLDDYEVEEADGEKINEKKVQRELERMHMRNILDDDQREVQMLQELLLEDGELHGSGRERKFRWKNAESLSWNTDTYKPKEEEEECEELESELQWRKNRHEREMFLKEIQQVKNKSQQHAEEDVANYSQIMKRGQKTFKISSIDSQNSSQKKTPVTEFLSKTDDIKLPFSLAIKRGSFLQRSETTLARLAEITRVTGNLGGPKNSKNFVFTSVEKTDIVGDEVNVKKRKAEEGTPKALKKLRIADMSPNVQSRKKKLNMS